MTHYLDVKKDYNDAILFYRLGDFYEMFFEDAELASRELELTLTGRDCGVGKRAQEGSGEAGQAGPHGRADPG